MRENIGEVSCPFHKRRPLVPVRRDKNGKLFFHCPDCGPVNPHGRGFQEWMLINARLDGAQESAA
jgi:hypothetical protein